MQLTNAQVFKYKSIEDSSKVEIDPHVTVLVGVNEAGKSAFLEALNKSRPVVSGPKFDYVADYPRRELVLYERTHAGTPAKVTTLTYKFSQAEVNGITADLGFELFKELTFTVTHDYANSSTIGFSAAESAFVADLVAKSPLTVEHKAAQKSVGYLRDLANALDGEDLNDGETEFLGGLKSRFASMPSNWSSWLEYYVWSKHLKMAIPKFLYFSDYNILPGKINLPYLQNLVDSKGEINDQLQTALSLFEMAGIKMSDLAEPDSYEEVKARLEAISNMISDKVFKYWKQNQELDVEFDIRADPKDVAPYNSGSNLYIRVRNRKHRVSVPFNQRSKGFIWFFSFIVWFNSVKERVGNDKDLVLLLDEPGLSLHGLAQNDFLDYIGDLAKKHQVIYTTHSPFMIDSDQLHQVRTVEDVDNEGTKVSKSLNGSDPRTIFPLQAGLGYTIAQNLFIAKKNVLVEGPADLLYLKFFSSILEQVGRTSLRDDIIIVPTGGLDKIATFVSLLAGNKLQFAVVHDFSGKPDQRLDALIKERILKDKQVLNYAQFRKGTGNSAAASDVEDLIELDLYLKLFNGTYIKELNGTQLTASQLPKGQRLVQRIDQHLKSNSISLRASGGYNHYLVASHLAANPLQPKEIDADTLDQFEQLFIAVNKLLP